jgi:ABC-type branched-subunit amino acid transport system permease subunit
MVITQVVLDWLHLFVFTVAVGMLLHEVGLISLGLTGTLLGGAYAVALASLGHLPPSLGVLAVSLLATAQAAAALRVRQEVFAVVTLAGAIILHRTVVAAVPWTGGSLGLGPLPRPDWLAADEGALAVGAGTAGLVAVAYLAAGHSTVFLRLGAIRDHELSAEMRRIAVGWWRAGAVLVAGVVGALVGSLQAMYFGLVTPQLGVLDVSLQALAAAMLARPAWRQGRPGMALVGYAITSAVLTLMPVLLRQLLPGSVQEALLRQALFGSVLYALAHPRVQAWLAPPGGRS